MKSGEVLERQSHFLQAIRGKLHEVDSDYRLFALLEAGASAKGATSDLVSALAAYPVKMWQMVPSDSSDIAELAPYLIDLSWLEADEDEALTTFADWLFKQSDFSKWGVFFISDHSFSETVRFLRKFTYIQFSAQRSYFRYYNPRIFETFHKNLVESDRIAFNEKVGIIIYFDFYNPEKVHISKLLGGRVIDDTLQLPEEVEEEALNWLELRNALVLRKENTGE